LVAEAVTLAHVARPVVLARGLDPARFEVVLASEPRYEALWRDLGLAVRPIRSIAPDRFLAALAEGSPLYDLETLRGYVREDLQVLREVAPDVVVGDFRLSLSVSARVAGIPYLAITNAYWSPYARVPIPMPELPMTRRLGVPLARVLFGLARPIAFALHCVPMDRLRREHGLPRLGPDLRRVYTDADHTLYADVPELVPTDPLPDHHHFLGPIAWSPAVAGPPWWDDLPSDRPIVYLTLGSSGRADLLGVALEAMAELPVTVVAATAGRAAPARVPANAHLADYLPGAEAAARSRLVVCNGGSPTTHQALAAGVPVLGLAANMDQHLNMAGVCRSGAGELIRSEHARAEVIREAVARMLDAPAYASRAAELTRAFARYPAEQRFRSILESVAGTAKDAGV
jgi:UDP:flavonoid glycosyltransferase YjiC (YdhE family)